MSTSVQQVIFNFHHACPAGSELVSEAFKQAYDLEVEKMGSLRRPQAPFKGNSLKEAWYRLCLQEIAIRRRQGRLPRMDMDFVRMVADLQDRGVRVSFIFRHPPAFALMIAENCINRNDVMPIWQVLDAKDLHTTHGAEKDRQSVFRAAINGHAPASIISIMGKEPNAEASLKVGLRTWGYVGPEDEVSAWQMPDSAQQARVDKAKRYALRESLRKLGVKPIYETLQGVRKELQALTLG